LACFDDCTCAGFKKSVPVMLKNKEIKLANLESLFFSLSYLLNKFPFRKENNIRDIYVQLRLFFKEKRWRVCRKMLRSEFLRISTGVEHSQAETATKTSAVSACASKFAHFVSIRINLVEFYTSLPGMHFIFKIN
jgi:hypothetical protein